MDALSKYLKERADVVIRLDESGASPMTTILATKSWFERRHLALLKEHLSQ